MSPAPTNVTSPPNAVAATAGDEHHRRLNDARNARPARPDRVPVARTRTRIGSRPAASVNQSGSGCVAEPPAGTVTSITATAARRLPATSTTSISSADQLQAGAGVVLEGDRAAQLEDDCAWVAPCPYAAPSATTATGWH